MTSHDITCQLVHYPTCVYVWGGGLVGMEVQVPVRVGGLVDHDLQAAVILTLEKYV